MYRIIWVGSGLRFYFLYRYHFPTILTHDHSSHTHLSTVRLLRRLLRLIWGLEVEVERVMVCGIMLVGSRFRFSILLRYHYQTIVSYFPSSITLSHSLHCLSGAVHVFLVVVSDN